MPQDDHSTQSLTLTAVGVTLFGVLIGIGTTVAFGVDGPWWLKLVAGVATTLALTACVKLSTGKGRGPLARLANWIVRS